MCKLKSAIILKNSVFIPDYDSHTDMLEELKIDDTRDNASRLFVRAELYPKNNDVFSDIDTWVFNVDQDIVPDWFVKDYDKNRMIEAVKKWATSHIFINVDNLTISSGRNCYIKGCKNVICKNSSVEAWENSSVVARGNSSVVARGNSSVEAWGNSSVVAWENSSVVARENSSVEAWENSSVVARGNSSVEAWGNSSVVARGNSSVEAWENSSVEAWEISSVVAWENSSVVAWENSSVVARENSSVVARENSNIIRPIWSSFNSEKLILSENSTFKDCSTKTLYQSGDFKIVTVTNGKIEEV